jgi:GT2 family glycosyltransferase
LNEPTINISLIVPVFNRPQEVEELLASLKLQQRTDFELILVEDGSSLTCADQVKKYQPFLNVAYFYKPNSGPGQSRNYGCARASGSYFVFLDSDCVVPIGYIDAVYHRLETDYVDAFGGPDMASDLFSPLQKAINYSMTSFITTGGIRGGGEKMDKFFPRSFNMGFSRTVFEQTGGFSQMRFGEDIDLSIRIMAAGFKTALIKESAVFHKRRTRFKQFFKQVYNSGIARVVLNKKHPGTLKPVHLLPSVFVLGVLFFLTGALFCPYALLPVALFIMLIFTDSTWRNRSLKVGGLSVLATFIQLFGYGLGFMVAFLKLVLLKNRTYQAFEKTFYD